MRKRKRLFGVLLIVAALIIMTLPVSEADAASSASDFVMEGSTLVKYRGTEKNVSVPDTVEIIGESAFEDKTGIELVVLPNSVKRIEAYAFWGCDSLDTVVLGRGLTEVGEYAFAGCKGLKQMSIPSNVRSICAQAFGDCVNMTDISIPVETLEIHESAFDGCAKLTIHCQEGSIADSFAKDFYEKQKEMPEYEDVPGYPSNKEEGNSPSVTPEPSATEVPQVTTEPLLEAGNTLGTTHIVGNRAVLFIDATNLGVKQETEAQKGTQEIQEALMENVDTDTIPKYTIVDGSIVADQAYYQNNSLNKVLLPEGIKEIGEFSFARSSLSEISIPGSVTDIAYGAFYHCDGLVEVTLPDSVCNVAPMAFAKTGWVENFLCDDSSGDFLISGGVLVAYRGSRSEVSVPDGVRVIASEVFQGHDEIVSLKLPDSLKVIGEAAFENCTGLTNVQINQGVEQIKDRAFHGDDNAKISVPSSVKELGLLALEGPEVVYEGGRPQQSYEVSATRLSNESYRIWNDRGADNKAEEDKPAGVTVVGLSGASASLDGAVRSYKLTISETNDSVMRKAWVRAKKEDFPESMQVFEWKLTDSSDIPLTKLGHQTLTVVFPVQDSFIGKELKVVTTDRNGQLEAVSAQKVLLNGEEALCIRTSHLSQVGIYSTGSDVNEELHEVEISLSAAAAPVSAEGNGSLFAIRLTIAALFVTSGILCIITGHRKKTE